MSKVRVRFAPSPTGYVHVGNARTALFNWLFARHHGGAFVLRIEDTDAERSKPEYERQLMEDLRWFGLDWDEGPDAGGPFGPYRQSERGAIYARVRGEADRARATLTIASARRNNWKPNAQEEMKAGRQPRYSGRCRKLSAEEVARRKSAGEPAAVRLKIVESSFFWNDRVHGPTTISSDVIGDPVLVRSEGLPAYNYAVVIDDHLMEITHVIRGDDHISNTPRQLALYRALGWEPPEFAHLSTILGPDRTRLSKTARRHFHGKLPRHGHPSRGAAELPGAAGVVACGWQDGNPEPGRIGQAILARPHHQEPGRVRHRQAQLAEPALYEGVRARGAWRNLRRRFCKLPVKSARNPGPEVLAWIERVLDAVLKNISLLSELPRGDPDRL